ncbi:hypothetical protein PCANC_11560 [Puccinia coronata f. sp. avenae]|uniref:Uncharacterized protein n=1 Tax=Puccinia coronata f. sp. avenae TaxID=200324 RepID=A0A2N5V7X2_9BASI|nr:hypothetical protein PCANC_11560 [Puccinia coronata f. sp. avenae]
MNQPRRAISKRRINRGLIAARPLGVRMPIRTPRKNGVQPLHAALERRAGAARLSPHAARHVHAYNRRAGVQSLHACLKGVQSLHALRTGVQALNGTLIRVPRYPYKGTVWYPYKGTVWYPYKGTLIRVPFSTLIRVPRYPYKGTVWYPYKGTLIRVPFGTLIRVPFSTLIRVPNGTLIRVPFGYRGTLIRVPFGTLIRVPFSTLIRVPNGTLIRVPFGTLIGVPFGTLIRVPFGTLIRVPFGTLIRVPRYPYKGTVWYPYKGTVWYPYKGTQGTLIRVPRPLNLRGLREPGRTGVHGQHACPAGPHAEPAVLTPFAFGGACRYQAPDKPAPIITPPACCTRSSQKTSEKTDAPLQNTSKNPVAIPMKKLTIEMKPPRTVEIASQLPIDTSHYVQYLPKIIKPYVKKALNVDFDGHCGF